jgi:hypothetical protein
MTKQPVIMRSQQNRRAGIDSYRSGNRSGAGPVGRGTMQHALT